MARLRTEDRLLFSILACLACLLSRQGWGEEILRLRGTPAQIGKQHGQLAKKHIRLMVSEYIGDQLVNGKLVETAQKQINTMKVALPEWFLAELNACADAAGLDRDVLLYAQCEGDIRSLPGCTTYVAFGEATHDGRVQMGRNFDYWGLESTEKCVRVFAVQPAMRDHLAFLSVGWTGILGGWTFYNEKGLFVANNLGGFSEKNPKGIPTLILQRIIAETASTVDEGIALIKKLPRMRGQAMVLGHAGDAASGVPPSAAVVLYDAKEVVVKRPEAGFVFHSSVGTDEVTLRRDVKTMTARPYDAIKAAGNRITLHSVAIDPAAGTLWVAHGTRPGAHQGAYIAHRLKKLLTDSSQSSKAF